MTIPGSKLRSRANLGTELRGNIRSGKYRHGDRLPTVRELSAKYRVSISTVDHVFGELENEGLIQRKRGSGVFVDFEQTNRRTNVLVCYGNSFEQADKLEYWSRLLSGIKSATQDVGFAVLLTSDPKHLHLDRCDGVLLCTDFPDRLIKSAPIHLPAISMIFPSMVIPYVGVDDFIAGKKLASHLIESGHSRIACAVTARVDVARQRVAGIKAALAESLIDEIPGGVYDLEVLMDMPHNPMTEPLDAWVVRMIREQGVTCVVAGNDYLALELIGLIRSLGLRVPEDVSVAGFDGLREASLFTPSLTTIAIPLEAVGRSAARMLIRVIEGETVSESKLYPTELIQGNSITRRSQ